ncbi:MAG: fructose-6-phosphate aldolase [Chloroflexi bacterium]|nr:fructose-6-phosphate aldolase [Chloroflexota bacterium]
MRLWLDTANIEEIRQGVRLGVISGVTTNPSLVAKEGDGNLQRVVTEICELVGGPVSAEVVATEVEGILAEARRIARWHQHVVVKIPCTEAGVQAISILAKEGVRINMTLTFSPNQGLLGALAGATYVSPFLGRLDDVGHDGMQVVADLVEIYDKYHLPTQVVAASVRHPLHMVAAAKIGAHIATVPYKVLQQMLQHPLTDVGLARFLKDWQQVAGAAVL